MVFWRRRSPGNHKYEDYDNAGVCLLDRDHCLCRRKFPTERREGPPEGYEGDGGDVEDAQRLLRWQTPI